MLQEFQKFAVKGNAIDLAVGVVVGGAFGKITSSLVNDILTPPLGLVLGGVDFSNLVFTLKEASEGVAAVTLNYGKFIQTIVDFTIIAFAMFMVIKLLNALKEVTEKKEALAAAQVTPEPPKPVEPSNQEKLLMEIRDLLKK
ncbi:MAG: large-conductance mechanosensitive channel protein MscL [Candidatus Cloacimonetes bacterium]|nr:large-conductance mechanosensitive channel protein MscL [Candidatus Cloacimonadota bacterium]